jgi:site-specific DNA recombinase
LLKSEATLAELQGLVFDSSGARLQPTHSKKHGRKYRYYVSSSIIRDAKGAKDGLRIPATDLERLVLRNVSAKLKDTNWIGDNFAPSDAQLAKAIIERAPVLAEQVENLTTRNTGILTKLVQRVTVSKKDLQIELRVNELRVALELSPTVLESGNPEGINITIHCHLLRCGKQIKLVMGTEPSKSTEPDSRLISEFVQARKWFSDLTSNKVRSLAEIASTHGVNQSHVSRRITLAMLAPDIVEMILIGGQPKTLTPERLKQVCPIPSSWEEQRALLLQ